VVHAFWLRFEEAWGRFPWEPRHHHRTSQCCICTDATRNTHTFLDPQLIPVSLSPPCLSAAIESNPPHTQLSHSTSSEAHNCSPPQLSSAYYSTSSLHFLALTIVYHGHLYSYLLSSTSPSIQGHTNTTAAPSHRPPHRRIAHMHHRAAHLLRPQLCPQHHPQLDPRLVVGRVVRFAELVVLRNIVSCM
jgi:hypothetical protein